MHLSNYRWIRKPFKYRDGGSSTIPYGLLPLFSYHTGQEAHSDIFHFCKLQRLRRLNTDRKAEAMALTEEGVCTHLLLHPLRQLGHVCHGVNATAGTQHVCINSEEGQTDNTPLVFVTLEVRVREEEEHLLQLTLRMMRASMII